MSRSYHVTRKTAASRAKNGEPEALSELSEKHIVKETTKKYRSDYAATRPSAKDRKLKNSFVVGVVKDVLRPKHSRSKRKTA